MKATIWACILTVALSGCNNNHKQGQYSVNYSSPDVITIDTANKMLGSYLNSINYTATDTNVEAFIFNAALLRKYMDSLPASDSIAYLKIMLAHKLSYINDGHGSQNAGFSNAALTVLIAGYSNGGNYIFFPNSLIVDNAMLCPNNCPPGTAGSPLFPVSIEQK